MEEIKALDFLNGTLTSLVELVRNKVAEDAKEEIEEFWAEKCDKANLEIASLKGEIESKNGIISDLQEKNGSLVREIAQLKAETAKSYVGIGAVVGVLQDSGTAYDKNLEDLLDSKISDIEKSSDESPKHPITNKGATKSGTASASGKRGRNGKKNTSKDTSSNKTDSKQDESIEETKNAVLTPSAMNADGPSLFDSNE